MSCLICNTKLCNDEVLTVKTLGIENLIKVSHARQDDLAEALQGLQSITLHAKCKRQYQRFTETENEERIYLPLRPNCKKPKPREVHTLEHTPISESSTENTVSAFETQYIPVPDFPNEAVIPVNDYCEIKNEFGSTQASDAEFIEDHSNKPFPFRENCFFCGLNRKSDIRNDYYLAVSRGTQSRIINALLNAATPHALFVLCRIQDIDLKQVRAKYHVKCFRRYIPKRKYRQPPKPQILVTMEKMFRHIEGSKQCAFTWLELKSILSEDDYLPRYTTCLKYLKQKYRNKIQKMPYGLGRILYYGELDVSKLSDDRKREIVENAKRTYAIMNKKRKKSESSQDLKENEECPSPEECADVAWSDAEEPPADETRKNGPVCGVCLSSDRDLDALGEHAEVYWKISADVVTELDPEAFRLCWECKAALRNIQNFHQKIQHSQNILNTKTNENLTSLSTLAYSPISLIDIKSSSKTVCAEEFSEDLIKEEVDEIYVNPGDDDGMQSLARDDEDVINYSEDDAKSDTGKTGIHEKLEVAKVKRKRNDCEIDTSLIIPESKRRRAAIKSLAKKKYNDLESEEDLRAEETKPEIHKKKRSNSSSSEESDPEWEEKVKKKVKSTEIDISKHYTIDVRTFETSSKIIREPIERHELDEWLKSERHSGYFRTLDRDSKCEKCISFVAEEDHFQLCHSKARAHVCHVCERTFASAREMAAHVADHYFVLMCDFCGYKCYNRHHIQDHVETHRKVVLCLVCGGTFQSAYIFGEHFDAIHRQATCNECKQVFKSKQSVEKHINRRHMKIQTERSIHCKLCKTTFTSYNCRKTHMVREHGRRDEAAYCVDCDKHFANAYGYRYHLDNSQVHISEEKRLALSLKRKELAKKKDYKCSVCDKSFSSSYKVNAHTAAAHDKLYKYICEYCNKAYLKKPSLTNHRKFVHEGLRPKKDKLCTYCGRGFNCVSTLRNHMRLHTGEKPFVCLYPNCDSRFVQKVALTSHIKHIHEKQPRKPGSTARAAAP